MRENLIFFLKLVLRQKICFWQMKIVEFFRLTTALWEKLGLFLIKYSPKISHKINF